MKRIPGYLIVVVLTGFTMQFFSCGRTGNDIHDPAETSNDEIPLGLKIRVYEALPHKGFNLWVPGGSFRISSLERVPRFPEKITGQSPGLLSLEGVRNEQISAQIALASTDPVQNLQVSVSDLTSKSGARISSGNVQIRFVKYVPVIRAYGHCYDGSQIEEVAGRWVSGTRDPDVVGDPLDNLEQVNVPAYHAQPVWFTFHIPRSAEPGIYSGEIAVEREGAETKLLKLDLTVHDLIIPDPEDYHFFLDIWFNYSAVAGYYELDPWSEAHWDLLKSYMKDLAGHGQRVILTVITDKPWPAMFMGESRPQTLFGYESMVQWNFDGDSWTFDFTIFDRYVETALEQGLGPWIAAYSLLPFRGQPRFLYTDQTSGKVVEESLDIGSVRWKSIWSAFLGSFSDHLKEKGWFDQIYLAFDERPAALMEEVKELVYENAPELVDRLFVAGRADAEPYSPDYFVLNHRFFSDHETVPEEINMMLKKRREEGKRTLYYTCCGPAHPNNFAYSPAVESQMLPWISAKYQLDGYLRWAYCSWPEEVYESPVFRFVQGDEYQVYPGPEGPLSSIRWELLKEGIEDYELIAQLRIKSNGRDSDPLSRALDLANRNQDARKKDLTDMIIARDILVAELMEE